MIPPPQAEVAPASKASKPSRSRLAPATRVSAALSDAEIFDTEAFRKTMNERLEGVTKPSEIRRETVGLLKMHRQAGRARIESRLEAFPRASRQTTRAYSYLTDCLVKAAFGVACERLHPNPVPTSGERLAVLAIGGYGRNEMAPFSDVDLLFLTPQKLTAWAESVIESTLYILWDLKLKVGHSSRSLRDCLKLGRDDITIRTSLLELRAIDGDAKLPSELQTMLRKQLFQGTHSQFTEAKLEERDARHNKQGGQRYMLEPNVKEAKGGLRDLQTLYWIAKYIHGVDNASELVPLGVFRQEEFDAFDAAESFLWAVRCHLHLLAGRAQDQLTFDLQVQIADRLGYSDLGGRRAVEHFMQDYFRHATRVGELTRIFLTALEASHVKKEPGLFSLFRGRKPRRKKVRDGYIVKQNRLSIANEQSFFTDPLNILRVFEEALRTGYLLHPDAMRAVASRIDLIDDELRASPDANKLFLDIMLKHGNPERPLRRMNELGVLGAFIPDFAPIVAMMQFNMYHSYTVDEHTIQVISTLDKIERAELVEELPVASGILKQGVNRRTLFVACLLHDIGKGRPQDHSVLGAQIAKRLCPRLGLKPAECETVEWLVRYHLLMSDTAQKRDIADPKTVRNFARAITSKERLDLLTVLTVCDIRGVGPNVWNNWKATLLRSLYWSTSTALEHGLEDVTREKAENEAKAFLRQSLSEWSKADLRAELGRHYGPYWQGLDMSSQVMFAEMLRGLDGDDLRIDTRPDADRDATRIGFALADHPGIFSRLAGAVSLVGANVVDARSYTTKDGFATAVFWVQDDRGNPYDAERLPRLKSMIEKTLKGEVIASRALEDREKIKKRERPFDVPTTITFNNEDSDLYTIIEVDTRDRPGLLYDLAKTLAAANVQIASAQIATYGAQVVDTFYVKDVFGLKLDTVARQRKLERKLRDAIARVAVRAGA